MRSILTDIKNILQQPGNGLMKIIVANGAIFIALMIARVGLLIAGESGLFDAFFAQVSLPSTLDLIIQRPWSLITYFFLHIEIFHLIFNMMFLYWFGTIIQDFIGNKRLVQLFFYGGLAGAAAFILAMNTVSFFIAKGPNFLNGASAGVFAVVVAAATIRPNYQVHLLLLGQVRIKYIAAFYVLWSFIETTGSNAGGNIAHLGGAILGFIFAKNFLAASKPQAIFEIKIKEFAQVVNQQFQARKEPETVPEDELNAILDKISQSGYDSLSDYEQKRLFKASQKND
ncbi:rhomboid family intramembrane serine protease [Aquirufa novilacunae]|jgi:membrane associated rhomboid family serine protease|uniref:Rhomboid family intramembrane serine protease n=1 Tax=Aquirufa novilacunae TaxID=3139305 RepID=A0ABW8U1P9_9BACT